MFYLRGCLDIAMNLRETLEVLRQSEKLEQYEDLGETNVKDVAEPKFKLLGQQ